MPRALLLFVLLVACCSGAEFVEMPAAAAQPPDGAPASADGPADAPPGKVDAAAAEAGPVADSAAPVDRAPPAEAGPPEAGPKCGGPAARCTPFTTGGGLGCCSYICAASGFCAP